MNKKERFKALVTYFTEHYPKAETELVYTNPYELLVAVILSAQCTDKRINLITPKLFERYPTPESLADSTADEVYEYIRSVSYPNNKSKHLVSMARMLVNEFHSEVPNTIEDLQKMPGVGRKTANVIVSVIYNQPAMAVDTHVFRTSHRLGLVPKTAKTAYLVEKELVKYLPEDKISVAHHWLILHGRYICIARTPRCAECDLKTFCQAYETGDFKTPVL